MLAQSSCSFKNSSEQDDEHFRRAKLLFTTSFRTKYKQKDRFGKPKALSKSYTLLQDLMQ